MCHAFRFRPFQERILSNTMIPMRSIKDSTFNCLVSLGPPVDLALAPVSARSGLAAQTTSEKIMLNKKDHIVINVIITLYGLLNNINLYLALFILSPFGTIYIDLLLNSF